MIDEVVGFTPGLDIVQLLGYSQAQIDYMLSNQRQMIEPSGQIDVQISDVGVPYVTDGKLVYPIGNWFIRFDKVSLVTPKFFGLTSATPPVNVSAPIYSSPSVTSAPGGQTTTTQDVAPGTTAVGNSTGPNQFQFNPGGGTAVGGLFSNTFMFDLGDGAATIQPGATSNTVRLGAGITASNLAFSDDAAGDLTISVVGTADNLIIEGDLLALNTGDGSSIISKVQNVTFSDGSLLSLDGNLSYSESVSSGNAVQSNTYGGSNFQFGSGGGTAVGGQFANSFAYGLGDGSAIIQPGSGSNVLSFGSGITASMLSYAANAAGDLTITVGNSGDSVTIEGNFAVQNGLVTSAVSSITLANGSSVLAAPPPLLAVQEQDVRLHVAPNAAFSFTLPANSFTDATGGTVTLSALQQNGTALPSWLSFAPSTGKFSGTMPTWQTTQGIKVIATTSEGAISAEGFNIYNTPPTPVLVTQQQDVRLHYAPTTAFSFVLPAGSFTDPAGGTVSLAATQPSGALPSWLSFNKSTGTFSGTMPAWQTTQGIVVTAITSEGATATEGFNIYNTAPAPVLQHQQNDLRVTFGVTFSATLPANSFTDPAGGTISLSATQANGGALPSCVQFNQSTGSLSGTMPINAATLGIKVSATSSEGGTAGEAFNFIGSAAAATLSAQMSDIRTTLGATISAAMPNPSFSDIYGSTFAYTAQQSNAGGALPSWLTFNASNATFSGVTPLTAGSLGVEIDAHGSYGTVGSEAFHIYW
nr:putative Ig domain-containing protein [uncultured Rhodopila sp.]